MLAKHEMFEKFGGGETSKHGGDVETISCQANNVGQFRQGLRVAERACDDVSKRILKPSTYRLHIFLARDQYLRSLLTTIWRPSHSWTA